MKGLANLGAICYFKLLCSFFLQFIFPGSNIKLFLFKKDTESAYYQTVLIAGLFCLPGEFYTATLSIFWVGC